MAGPETARSVDLFSTCPPSSRANRDDYRRQIIDVARWSEEAGCTGILVYADNSQVDPWLAAQIIVEHTRTLSPLVALQPVYMHPYSAAKMVASLGWLYGRRLCLNLVAGGFRNDLIALRDPTPHDRRYERLVEYTTIVKRLLAGETVTFEGRFYVVEHLTLAPPLPQELAPRIYISGSSDAGLAAARAVGATAIKYPKPPGEEDPLPEGLACGVRIGIVAREDAAGAWALAHARFPEDRRGQLTRQLAARVSDSTWHEQLSRLDGAPASPYWLHPFQNYQTMCPYLVGGHGEVAEEVERYIAMGYRTFILDVPACSDDLQHTRRVFERTLT